METKENINHWNSIAEDMFELWIVVWNFVEKIIKKIKNLLSKK